MSHTGGFNVVEATIADIHHAFAARMLTAKGLVERYLERIAAYDKAGPNINAVISLNPNAVADAERLDAACAASGPVGPLSGIVVAVKDQADVREMPTTLGSVLFRDHMPGRDCFVATKLRQAGAILLAKTTLGEFGGGDTHGSLFGSTRNPYDLERTVGGSSGGSAACVSANFTTVAIGQEGFASIRRPSIWCGIVGMRPSIGLVSRTGVFGGWPAMSGSLGPMARCVADAAKLLDVMVGYDPEDPSTALGVGRAPPSYAALLDASALRGARIGIVREVMGIGSDPASSDFREVDAVFNRAVDELRAAGAHVFDPIVIPDLVALLKARAFSSVESQRGFKVYFDGCSTAPFASRDAVIASPLFDQLLPTTRARWQHEIDSENNYHASLLARDRLRINLLKVMADHRLDAVVHKAVEHGPTRIRDGVNPPYVDQLGSPHINTFLQDVPSVAVPAGFTAGGLPAGITFLGRPYSDGEMLRLAYAYEQATQHRMPPSEAAWAS